MNKINNVYSKVISKENLYRAAYMASRGRRYKDAAADFNFFLEQEIDCLEKELSSKTYCHGKYRTFTIYEPKERKIAAAPFRDRVVHHAVHGILEPLIDKEFIYDSYACRKGKGTHKAVGRAQSFFKLNEFCFHGDIRKYFPSIDHDILKDILRRKIEDEDLLWLLDGIIDSAVSLTHCSPLPNSCAKALPLGNLTSQFFANLYLNELDYFVKVDLREKHYLRYMDDFLVFGNSKGKLQEIKNKVRMFLEKMLNLDLHEGKSQIYKTRSGVKFLGFRMFKNYRKLASNNVRNLKKRLKRFDYLLSKGKIEEGEIKDSIRCWVAHSKYADTKALRLRMRQDLIEKKTALGEVIKDVMLGDIDTRAQDIAPLHAREMGNDACKINPVGAQHFAPAMKNASEMKYVGAQYLAPETNDERETKNMCGTNVGAQYFAPVIGENNADETKYVGAGSPRSNETTGRGNRAPTHGEKRC